MWFTFGMDKRCDVILLGAGASRRFSGSGGPAKQFMMLGDQPVWAHALRPFQDAKTYHGISLGQIVLVLPADFDSTDIQTAHPNLICTTGGSERHLSVYQGLSALHAHNSRADFVLIHDVARPFCPDAVLDRLLGALAKGATAAIPALPVADTIKQHHDGYVEATLPRCGLARIQTPQAFDRAAITKLHEKGLLDGYPDGLTDDAMLFEEAGLPVKLVEGAPELHKITWPSDLGPSDIGPNDLGPSDLDKAETMVHTSAPTRFETRHATGFDVHRFADDAPSDGHIMICGVPVAHDKRLLAHSDGDVGLHALCDALFGCLASGDIGTHFPPSDPQWKDARSDQFLAFAVDQVAQAKGRIVHLDVTLICERPKIGPERARMQEAICAITHLPASRVSIKATTSERLGFTGRGEGIAAMASASIELPFDEGAHTDG